MKNILIIGKDSYIGEAIYKWLLKFDNKYNVEIVSSIDNKWKEKDYKNYDTVIDLAGIAHIMNITDDMKELFYSINRDLTIEIAQYAKTAGVKHFIFFSSMNVYGDYCQTVKDRKMVNPTSFYGDSKLQGDEGVQALSSKEFLVASVRPPFVYGKGCKGNYNTISKIAKKTPIFPTFNNKKSMIYIDNLCEFIRLVIDNKESGILTPQNKELISTADLVKEISSACNHKVLFTSLFNIFIKSGIKINSMIRRAFSDDCYDINLSNYYDWNYCVVDFKTSIKRIEGK